MALTNLPPELLGIIVDRCAADLTNDRAALLSLSTTNTYIRSVTKPRLFERIFFRDNPHSSGDEVLHSIRRFMAAPELRRHARTVSLCLARVKCLGQDHAASSEPYHYLVLPELVQALAEMPGVAELSIRIDGAQGMICLEGLHAAVRWSTSGQQLNIRSLTVSPYTWTASQCVCDEVHNARNNQTIDFLSVFPQITALSFERLGRYPDTSIWCARNRDHRTIASNLTHLSLYKPVSGPGLGLHEAWEENLPRDVNFAELTPQLEHLSILGHLRRFPVWLLMKRFARIPKLRYIDITDEQVTEDPSMPHDRSSSADKTFESNAQLRRIIFVRKGVGEVYFRGYWLPVADSTGYISEDVSDADLAEIPSVWWHGVPQSSLTPFPSFTP